MEKMTISAIKKEAAKKGTKITLCRFMLNGRPSYRVTDKEGNERTMAKDDLIIEVMQGTL